MKIPHAASDVTEHVTLSLGVTSVLPDQKVAPMDLIKAADASLYQAKRQGRNQVS